MRSLTETKQTDRRTEGKFLFQSYVTEEETDLEIWDQKNVNSFLQEFKVKVKFGKNL